MYDSSKSTMELIQGFQIYTAVPYSHVCTHWGTEAWIQTHLLGYIAMLGMYII